MTFSTASASNSYLQNGMLEEKEPQSSFEAIVYANITHEMFQEKDTQP
jgi:hypothetical protein